MYTSRTLTFMMGQTMNLAKLQLVGKFKSCELHLNFDQYIILHLINLRKDITQQDLANHFQRDKSIILRQIGVLIDLQYVERLLDKSDKRKKNLVLTQKGVDVLNKAIELSHELSTELLHGVTDEEFRHFELVIDKIQANTQQTNLFSNYGK